MFVEASILNSNAVKQHIQQTAVQRAMQPVGRYINTGLEQVDIHDTDDAMTSR